MKPSEKERQPTDEGDLEQTKRIMERLVRKPRKPEGKKASKHREDKKTAITSWTSRENMSKQHRAETFLSPAEQSAFYAWLERRKRASPRIKLHGDGPSAKKSRRPAPSKPDARRAAVTQAADMSHYAPQTRGVVVPEDICAGAMPRGIMEPPSSDPGMNSPTTLWDSSVGQSSSDPHTSQCPFTPRDSINFTKSARDGRKSVMKILFRRRAPVLPPMGLARPVNRLNAAVALFGAFGAFALALALTPGTQPSRSSAKDSHGQLAISEVKPQATAVAEASPPAPVLAALPQQAAKSDRLSRPVRAPQPTAADRLPDSRSLRGPVRGNLSERDIAMAGERPGSASKAPAIPLADLEPVFDVEASKSPAPSNTGADDTGADDTGVGDIDIGGEVSALAIDEASEQASVEASVEASDEAIDEASDEAVTATRSSVVTTDVNMRAGPDNAAAVIMVVPGKSDVEVIGCDHWCEVVFAGKRGWIYQRFVGAADSTAGMSGTTRVTGTTGRGAETIIPTALAARRAPVAIDGIGRLASLSADDLRTNLHALDPGDVSKLKTNCAEVLRSPAAYSANTRAVCERVTSL